MICVHLVVENSQWAMASFALAISLKDPRIETKKLFSTLGGVNSYLNMTDFSQPQKNKAWLLFPYLSCLGIWLTELLNSRNNIPQVELLSVPSKTGDLLVAGSNQTLQRGLFQSQRLDRRRLLSGVSVELGVPLITFDAGGDVVSDWEIEGRPNWAIAFPIITSGTASFVLYASGILPKDAHPDKDKVFSLLTAYVSCLDKLLKSVSNNTKINSLLPITFIRAPIEKEKLFIGFADEYRIRLRNLSIEAAKAAQTNNVSYQSGPCKRMTVITVATHFTPEASDRQRKTVLDSLPLVVWRIAKHFPKIKAEAYEMSTYNGQNAVAILFPEPMTIEEITLLRNQILVQIPKGRLDIYAPATMIEGREQAIGEIGVRLLNYSTKHLSQEWRAVGLRWLDGLSKAIHEDLQENNAYKLLSSICISYSNHEADDPERWAQRLATDVKATITIMPLLHLVEQYRRKHNYLAAMHTWDQAITELAGIPACAYLYRLKADIMTEKSLHEDNPKLAWVAAEASLKALLEDPSAPRYWYCLANSLLLTTDIQVLCTAEICLEALKEINPSYRRRWLLETALQWVQNRPTKSIWNTAIGNSVNEYKTDIETACMIENIITSRLDVKPFVSLDHSLLPVVLRQLRLLAFRSALLKSQRPLDSKARQKSNNN